LQLSEGGSILLSPPEEQSISITEFSESNSHYTNTTLESNFSHLDINTIDIYDNLVLYLPFDINHSNKNNITCDYSQYENDGTVYNEVPQVSSIYGKSLEFDGEEDYINISYSPSLNFDSSDSYSVMAWFRLLANDNNPPHNHGTIIQKLTDDNPYPFGLWIEQNQYARFQILGKQVALFPNILLIGSKHGSKIWILNTMFLSIHIKLMNLGNLMMD